MGEKNVALHQTNLALPVQRDLHIGKREACQLSEWVILDYKGCQGRPDLGDAVA